MIDLERRIYGMRSAAIFLEAESDAMSERDCQIGHLALMAFDEFEKDYNLGGPFNEIAGFRVRREGGAIIFDNTYGARPAGLIDSVLRELFPDEHFLFRNEFPEENGGVFVRGLHANDVMRHPYTAACFGGERDCAELFLQARLYGLKRLGIPQPSKRTIDYMHTTLRHNLPGFGIDVSDYMSWLEKCSMEEERELIQDRYLVTSLKMTNCEEKFEGNDLLYMVGRRLRFISRHRGSSLLFGPFVPEDSVLACIRHVVQVTLNLQMTDTQVELAIGAELWGQFTSDPEAFCKARMNYREVTPPVEDGLACRP